MKTKKIRKESVVIYQGESDIKLISIEFETESQTFAPGLQDWCEDALVKISFADFFIGSDETDDFVSELTALINKYRS